MNDAHLRFLASPVWAEMLENDLVPWLAAVADLGDDVLEIGPGPGLTTDLLRPRTRRLTAIEADADLAAALAARLAGTNVDVVHGDGTDSGLPSDRFSAVTCFSMLHHLPSADLQDLLFAEAHRVTRPGGTFLGVDSRDLEGIRAFHDGDVFVPVDPETFGSRLEAAAFTHVHLEPTDYEIRFSAKKPFPSAAGPPALEPATERSGASPRAVRRGSGRTRSSRSAPATTPR